MIGEHQAQDFTPPPTYKIKPGTYVNYEGDSWYVHSIQDKTAFIGRYGKHVAVELGQLTPYYHKTTITEQNTIKELNEKVARLERALNEKRSDISRLQDMLNTRQTQAHFQLMNETRLNGRIKSLEADCAALNKENAENEKVMTTCRYAMTVQAMAIYELESILGQPEGMMSQLWMKEFYDKVAEKFLVIREHGSLVTDLIKHSVKTVAQS